MPHDPPLSECATLGEIAAGIGITDQALFNLKKRYPDTFPQPLRRVGIAELYWTQEVEAFHFDHGYGYGHLPKGRR